MNNFRVISKKFYNQFRNGQTFNLNLTDFTERLQGNSGEILQFIEQIEVSTIVNEDKATEFEFIDNTTTVSLVSDFIDWNLEGIYKGASVTVTLLGTTAVGTIEEITGSTKQNLVFDSTGRTNLLAAGLIDGQCISDIVFTVTTRPDFINYKYGLIPNSATVNDYKSPFDDNEQSYNLRGITGAYQSMVWTGTEIASDLGSTRIKFDSTVDAYKHTFTVEHTFKIPYYKEGELSNIENVLNPVDLQSSNSLKYCNGFFFGGDKNDITMKFEDLGEYGNVGYFDSNYNGTLTNYSISSYAVSNSLNTGGIEATLTNTVTFNIASAVVGGYLGGEDIIITHSKLPTEEDYARNKNSYDDVWLFENLRQTEGAGAVSGTIITNLTVTLNIFTTELEVSFDISYTSDQQDLLDDTKSATIYVTTATQNLANPETQDRSNIQADTSPTTKDTDVKNLASLWTPLIYEQWDSVTKTKGFTNFDGYDGDLMIQYFTFSTDVTQNAIIRSAKFCIVLDDGTDIHELECVNIPIDKIVTQDVGIGTYQVFNTFNVPISLGMNLPSGSVINQINMQSIVPVLYNANQQWTGSIGFNVPWRDWVENLNIPTSFIDYTKPHDNRNNKTSNYSGVGAYTIKTMLELEIDGDGAGLITNTVQTTYQLLSDSSAILDFDDTTATTFTATTFVYDYLGVISQDLPSNLDGQIKIEFAHTLGVITLADIQGYIKIEIKDSTIQPWFLGVNLDFTNVLNPLRASDTLTSGNTTLVEVISINNKVTFICNTNAANIQDGLTYNIYGRISNKV